MTDIVKEPAAQEKVNLLDFDHAGLTAWCAQIGEKPFRATQLSRWLHRHVEGDFDRMTNLAKAFRAKLKDLAEVRPPVPITEKKSADGTRKWLFDVGNGNAVESVFIPEDDRGTLCISSQAGCAMGCLFCSTGKQGFNRNLTTAEIVGQLWWAERELRRDQGVTDPNDRIISNVVLMGMGEPLQNLDNVVRAIKLFLDDNGYGLSRRRVTESTSGLVHQMDKLGEETPVALAVSLHAANDELRDKLMPVNRKHPLADLMAACRRYLRVAPRDFITFEYVMLGGINDSLAQADELIRLVRREAAARGLDPNRIGVMGSSAGGHLALMAATSSRRRAYWPIDDVDKTPCNVQWSVEIYPAYGLTDGADRNNVHGGNLDEDRLVPEFAFDLDTPPMLFIHGDADGWAAMNSVKCWEQLRRMGIQGELHTLALRDHCFQRKASEGTGSYTWLDRIWEFLSAKGFNK